MTTLKQLFDETTTNEWVDSLTENDVYNWIPVNFGIKRGKLLFKIKWMRASGYPAAQDTLIASIYELKETPRFFFSCFGLKRTYHLIFGFDKDVYAFENVNSGDFNLVNLRQAVDGVIQAKETDKRVFLGFN